MAHFVAAARQRNPGVEVVQASAESLPFGDDAFDRTLAQLVVHFMTDPVAGIAEMARVTRPRALLPRAYGTTPATGHRLSPLWRAARAMDPAVDDEANLAGAREGDLAQLFRDAGLRRSSRRPSLPGSSTQRLTSGGSRIRAELGRPVVTLPASLRGGATSCAGAVGDELSDGPFVLTFQAWSARGQPGE